MGNGCYGRTLPKQIHTKIPKYIPTVRRGRVMNVYDGDTIKIAGYVDYNPTLYSFSVRFNGLDCPESNPNNLKMKPNTLSLCWQNNTFNPVQMDKSLRWNGYPWINMEGYWQTSIAMGSI